MPIIHSAKKKMRQDRMRTKVNKEKKETLKKALKLARLKPTVENISKTQSIIDKTAKAHLIHKNKAARLKSQIARLIGRPKGKQEVDVRVKIKSASRRTKTKSKK